MPQSLAYNNAVLANTITASGTNVGVNTTSPSFQLHVIGSGYASSGLSVSGLLTVNGTGVSTSGHTHTASNITDFNSTVSGLLPVKDIVAGTNVTVSSSSGIYTINSTAGGGGGEGGVVINNSGDNRILTSTGSTSGINAESNLTFDGSLLTVSGSGYFTNGCNISGILNAQVIRQPIVSGTDAATITFDMNQSNVHTVRLGGNRTLAVTNVAVGQRFTIRLKQDTSPPRTVTWFSGIYWPSNRVPILTRLSNAVDVFSFICTASGKYDGYIVGYNFPNA